MNDIQNSLFEAIDTIIDQKLNQVSIFDKTEICTIVKQDEKNKNKYWVTNEGGLKYEAYDISSEIHSSYLENSRVYVTIPQGNYELRKIIIGKYTADELPKNLYTNPFSYLISAEQCVIQGETSKEKAIKAYRPSDPKGQANNIAIIEKSNLNFTKNGLGQYNYVGINFSLTTGFGGTSGEFYLSLDFLDDDSHSLIDTNLLTISSKQLYGNPYYLNSSLQFQHLFNFPIGEFEDLTQIKQIKLELKAKDNFNYVSDDVNNSVKEIILNNFTLYLGFDSSEENMSNTTVALSLDSPATDTVDDYKYSSVEDKKELSIDWLNKDNNAIYNETNGMFYPISGEYTIYWLQYCRDEAYTKQLENKDIPKNMDIDESGPYWKTVKRTDAHEPTAYRYTLTPRIVNGVLSQQEQVKVMIKNNKTGTFINSKAMIKNNETETFGLTFTNASIPETSVEIEGLDNLKFTLSDSGIYNQYGIDNKLITSTNKEHSVTVDYIENIVWDSTKQNVIWKIPAVGSMLAPPMETKYIYMNSDGKEITTSTPPEDTEISYTTSTGLVDGWVLDDEYYIFTNYTNNDGKTIKFEISNQFGYNKTNNTILCEITREDTTTNYYGSVTLQFGTQGTSGSTFAFNIYPASENTTLDINSETSEIEFMARLEDNYGKEISLEGRTIKWYFLYGAEEIDKIDDITGSSYIISKSILKERFKRNDIELDSKYAILVAELEGITTEQGTQINLKAYYPIVWSDHTKNLSYITGASRIVYNHQGTNPNYDNTSYGLYYKDNNLVSGVQWELQFANNGETDDKSLLSLITTDEGVVLKPNGSLTSGINPCRVIAKQNGITLWYQPLLVLTNQYAYDFINAWDGAQLVDGENNRILTQLVGAGIKNSDNTYTGVLMGTVGKDGSAQTGLYGYESGELRFKLNDKGAFFVGYIDSTQSNSGSYISFNEGIGGRSGRNQLLIKANNLTLNSAANEEDPVFKFSDKIQLLANGEAKLAGWRLTKEEILGGDATKSTKTGMGINDYFFAGAGRYQRPGYELGGDPGDENYPFLTRNELEAFLSKNSSYGDINNLKFVEINNTYTVDGENWYQFYDGPTSGFTNIKPDGGIITNGLTIGRKHPADYMDSEDSGHWELDTRYPHLKFDAATCTFTINQGELYSTSEQPLLVADENGLTVNGTVYATGGAIADWDITPGQIIYVDDKNDRTFYLANSKSSASFWLRVSPNDYSSTIFGIRRNGNIVANGGTIGKWTIKGLDEEKIAGRGALVYGTDVSTGFMALRPMASTLSLRTKEERNGAENDDNNYPFLYQNATTTDNYTFKVSPIGHVYCTGITDTNGSDNNSDINIKNSIENFPTEYETLFDNLKPCRFKYNYSNSDRYHTGFIAQEVYIGLDEAGLTSQDFAALVHLDTPVQGAEWQLRKDEFVALNTWQIQKLKTRVTELEQVIKELKNNEI